MIIPLLGMAGASFYCQSKQPRNVSPIVHHGLVVCISNYDPPIAHSMKHPWHEGEEIAKLPGCANDYKAMMAVLTGVYHWRRDETSALLDHKASWKAIWHGLDRLAAQAKTDKEKHLKSEILFYFAGHGSTVRNSLAGKLELDDGVGDRVGYSNTIVPADSSSGSPDITDKELAKKFNVILDTGATLTAIFDSCYSGEMARAFGDDGAIGREVGIAVLKDHPESDVVPAPYERGALILSGARHDQPAEEYPKRGRIGLPRGIFSMCLTNAITELGAGASVGDLMSDAVEQVSGNGYPQEPVDETTQTRLRENLFGEPPSPTLGLVLVVARHPSGKGARIVLNGDCLGLGDGSILEAKVNGQTAEATVSGASLGSAVASFSNGSEYVYKRADFFTVKERSSGRFPGLVAFVPRTRSSLDAIISEAQAIERIHGQRLTADPAAEAPRVSVWQEAGTWLVRNGEKAPVTIPGLASLSRMRLQNTDRLFVSYPLPVEMDPENLLGGRNLTNMISSVDSLRKSPDYVLVGRYYQNSLQYAWIAPGSVTGRRIQRQQPYLREMPLVTPWHVVGDNLVRELNGDLAKLCVLKNWSALRSVDDASYPIQLELVDTRRHTEVRSGSVVDGIDGDSASSSQPNPDNTFEFSVTLAHGSNLKKVQGRYLYLMEIGPDWSGRLVFPEPADISDQIGEIEHCDNYWKPTGAHSSKILHQPDSFYYPFGTEDFVLVTSNVPIRHDVFSFSGFAPKSSARDFGSPLENLLRQASSGSRDIPTTPQNWSISRLIVTSVAPNGAGRHS